MVNALTAQITPIHMKADQTKTTAANSIAQKNAPSVSELHLPDVQKTDVDVINFYDSAQPFYEFTNFFTPKDPIRVDGKNWSTSEHYFQAMKFKSSKMQEQVRLLKTPREAFTFAREHVSSVRPDWHKTGPNTAQPLKNEVMRKVVRAKFTNNPHLKQLLLSTGDARLREDSAKDSYWGVGRDGKGKNMLGRILMEVRSELKG